MYEVIIDESGGDCSLRITSETTAFYVSYGYSKTIQICKSASVGDYGLSLTGCSEPEEVYDFCMSPKNARSKDLCKTHEALEKKNVSICDEIVWEWGNQDCKSR